jgi:hypothetical protein
LQELDVVLTSELGTIVGHDLFWKSEGCEQLGQLRAKFRCNSGLHWNDPSKLAVRINPDEPSETVEWSGEIEVNALPRTVWEVPRVQWSALRLFLE